MLRPLFCTIVLAASTHLVWSQQTTVINHYLGNEPKNGDMMQYVLRSSEAHSVVINYYQPATEGDEGRLARLIADAVDFYIDRSVLFDGRTVGLRSSPKAMQRDLNQIVSDAVRYYHFHDSQGFDGFSKRIAEALENLNGLQFDDRVRIEFQGTGRHDAQFAFIENALNEVKRQIHQEIGLYAGGELLVQVDSREERLKAEQDSLLAAVRNFKTNDPLTPLDVSFSTETLNLLAGDDPFILPTFSTSTPDDFENSDLAERILTLLEQQRQQFDELKSDVDALKQAQEANAMRQRSEEFQLLQDQIDLLRELVATLADQRTASNTAYQPNPKVHSVGALPGGFDLYFSVGGTGLDLNTRLRLHDVIDVLVARPDLLIMLTGYADASGNREHNLRLSKQRATAVRDYLLKSGLPSHRVIINFFGDERALGADRDRRVELRFIPRD
jgi:outer membrane protein OmpA-like peptidoglycan-associated protein